jgi:hypothetical protein
MRPERFLQLVSLIDGKVSQVSLVLAVGSKNHAPAHARLKKMCVTCVGPEPRSGPVTGRVCFDGSVVDQMPGEAVDEGQLLFEHFLSVRHQELLLAA